MFAGAIAGLALGAGAATVTHRVHPHNAKPAGSVLKSLCLSRFNPRGRLSESHSTKSSCDQN
jgi:hypothetical protein